MSRPTNDHTRQKVHATLLRARRPLSASEIACHLGIDGPSADTVRAVCDGLVAGGAARRLPGRWARYERVIKGE